MTACWNSLFSNENPRKGFPEKVYYSPELALIILQYLKDDKFTHEQIGEILHIPNSSMGTPVTYYYHAICSALKTDPTELVEVAGEKDLFRWSHLVLDDALDTRDTLILYSIMSGMTNNQINSFGLFDVSYIPRILSNIYFTMRLGKPGVKGLDNKTRIEACLIANAIGLVQNPYDAIDAEYLSKSFSEVAMGILQELPHGRHYRDIAKVLNNEPYNLTNHHGGPITMTAANNVVHRQIYPIVKTVASIHNRISLSFFSISQGWAENHFVLKEDDYEPLKLPEGTAIMPSKLIVP